MKFEVAAIRALERGRDVAGERQPAAVASRGLDKADLLPAMLADVALVRPGPVLLAELADGWIEEGQRGLAPLTQAGGG